MRDYLKVAGQLCEYAWMFLPAPGLYYLVLLTTHSRVAAEIALVIGLVVCCFRLLTSRTYEGGYEEGYKDGKSDEVARVKSLFRRRR